MLIVDETGDRKDGDKTAHVGRQYLGNRGKIENGVVSVGSLWADESVYYPLAVEPYTPGALVRLVGKADPAFRTKPQHCPGAGRAGAGRPTGRSGRWFSIVSIVSLGSITASRQGSRRAAAPPLAPCAPCTLGGSRWSAPSGDVQITTWWTRDAEAGPYGPQHGVIAFNWRVHSGRMLKFSRQS